MKKAWTDLKSFVTVAILLLFGYCIIRQLTIPEELKSALNFVLGYFLGSKINNKGSEG